MAFSIISTTVPVPVSHKQGKAGHATGWKRKLKAAEFNPNNSFI